ncbi:alpha/beta hydrolase [Mycobacterium montefiorense]|uniref:Lipase/esterase n=1 Tax=Mycobacterium montefiorense TaxID=154654 RepID=A0AA37PKB2_9MYCO|nr:alpha/beta hydrolase [Mycobacterium montefiorense]GBG38777.1 putative lipase/esterase [Mycobacterium montefiorense]GKU34605.1 putative lipase/esterase [Mycobacterium montefiorense]GKU38086.1 putative lipase/esterase [Mycobacterium montefiorense]GKU43374.1 putative lipase/esterase [Mycobacterium montefiorense]GKU49990.1 putative lipase/esterase [Mycobacterium montefiorense]
MDDPVNGSVQAMLDQLNTGFPRVENMTGSQARAAVAERRMPVNNLDDVQSAADRSVPGPNGAIPIRVYHPHGVRADDRAAIVFYHGGGFVFCGIESHDGFCRALARGSQAVVVSVDYRLAPEHRAPAAALDAYTVFRWAIEHATELGTDPMRTAVAGDSAGGNLAAVTAILCRDRGVTQPVAQLLCYPAIDPSCDTDSYQRYGTGYFNTRAAMQWYWRQYLGDGQVFDPPYLVAPADADSHAGLAPAVIVTAGLDPLHSEGCDYAHRLRDGGVPVVHRDFPGLFHGFMTIQSFGPAASALQLVCADLGRLLRPAYPDTST